MLQNARVTAFAVSELLRENQQEIGGGRDKMMSCLNYLLLLECCDLGNVVYSLMVDSESTLFGIGEVIDVARFGDLEKIVCVCVCVCVCLRVWRGGGCDCVCLLVCR